MIKDKYIEHYTICKKNISNPLLAEKYIGRPVVGYILREEDEPFGLESKYNVQRIIQGTLTHINKESGKPFIVTDDNFPYFSNKPEVCFFNEKKVVGIFFERQLFPCYSGKRVV